MVHTPSEAAHSRLGAFLEEGGYFVTTGQQPGLFSGPLYSLYKALTAIKLAEAIEKDIGKPVLPLFWIASEDHDWDESDHTHSLDVENRLQTFRVPPQRGAEHRPLHRISLETGLEDTRNAFEASLPNTDFSRPLMDLLRSSYEPGCTLPQGFHGLFQGLLSDLPILFVDSAHPELKAASATVLLRELRESEAHEELLAQTSTELEEEGFHTQVPILAGGINLFLEGKDGRDRLYRDGNLFRLHRAGTRLTEQEIRTQMEDDPSVLSPNVLLRPVVENSVFPTVAYVGGPGEMAYYAQLSGLFRAHGIRMPVVHPRRSAVLIERKIGKVLAKFHRTPDSLARPHHELAGEIASDEIPPDVRKAFGEIRGAVGKGTGQLAKAVQGIDPTLKGPVGQARNTAFAAFDEAEKKIIQALKRENEIALEQVEKAQGHLYPLGKPQERVLNPLYYLTRYGPNLIQELLAEFAVALGDHSA